MILATHVIFSAYGFWLPDDPRGSWSDFVAAWELLLVGGKATKLSTRESVAWKDHNHEKRFEAKRELMYPPVEFTGIQALAISKGFATAITESAYSVYACAILPEHVHAVIGRHENTAGQIIGHLKARATQELARSGLHPLHQHEANGVTPTPWGRKGWEVFLNAPLDVQRAIAYVEQNPIKEGKKRQAWSFVMPYG